MIQAVIFDWAGTTVDYGCFAPVQAFQEAFAHHGVPVTLKETRKPMGMLKRDHIRTMLRMERIARAWEETHGRPAGEEDVEAVYAQFEPKLFSILDQFSTPKPFAVETAAALREMGLKIGSTTGYTDSMMHIVVPKAAQLGYAPDFWISPDGVGGKGRPYPYMIFENLKALEVSSVKNAVKVGDTVSGAPLLPCMKCDDCQQGNFSLCKHYSFIGSRQQGSNADYVVVPEQNAVPFDKSVSYEQGAMFEPATVAIHGVFQNDYHGGEYVAILGGGTVGMFTMQWTKIFGSKKVVVFDISNERLDLAKRLGADEVINTKEEGYMEKAMAITGGKGYGFVFETAGQVPTMHMAFELAANKAHVCFIGTPHENLTFTPAQWENMNRKEFKLTGSWMSYSAPFPGREWDLTAHYFATGQLKFDPGFVYKKIPMSQAQEAFQLFKTPGLVKGKILLSNEEE